MKTSNKEWLELRKELDRISKLSHQYRMTMFSVVSLIFAYLFSVKDLQSPIGFLVPVLIIYVFFLIHLNLMYNTYYISSYLNAFKEEFYFKWESRTNLMRVLKLAKYKYDDFNKYSFSRSKPFIILKNICFFIYFAETLFLLHLEFNKLCSYVVLGIVCLFLSCKMIYEVDFHEKLKDMITDWNAVKEIENKL